MKDYFNSKGELVGYKAYVNVPSASGGKSWTKRAKVFRFDQHGGKRNARTAAEAWRVEQKRKLQRGELLDLKAQRLTVEEFWQERRELMLQDLRPNVRRNYVSAYKNDIGPALGKVVLTEFKRSHIDVLKAAMRARRMAPSTQNGTITALSKILDFAVKERLIERNYASDPGVRLRVPKPLKGERVTATPEQVEEIATAIDKREPGLGAPVRVAFYTGVRAEELWALQAGDIDLNARRLVVDRAWVGSDENGRVLGAPKSGKGRVVPILEPVRELLTELVAGLDAHDWLFVGKRGNPIWHSGYRKATNWKELVAELGHPGFRFHDLRHSCTSWLIEQGVVPSVVQSILGHSDLRVTQRYIHTPDRLLDDVIRMTEGMTERKSA